MDEIDMHEGFDVGLEMSGNPRALRDMIGSMNNGAKVALLGILADEAAIDWNQVIFKGLTLKGIYGREMYETWYKMLAMLQSGLDVTPVITHRLPMAEYEKGFAALNAGQACKVVLAILVKGVARSFRPFPRQRTWAPVPRWTASRSRPTSSERRRPVCTAVSSSA